MKILVWLLLLTNKLYKLQWLTTSWLKSIVDINRKNIYRHPVFPISLIVSCMAFWVQVTEYWHWGLYVCVFNCWVCAFLDPLLPFARRSSPREHLPLQEAKTKKTKQCTYFKRMSGSFQEMPRDFKIITSVERAPPVGVPWLHWLMNTQSEGFSYLCKCATLWSQHGTPHSRLLRPGISLVMTCQS